MTLTPKQQIFVNEYLVDFNGTQAAIRAGYSDDPKVAAVQAHDNLKHDEIKTAVDKAIADRVERLKISQDWVVARLVENVEQAMRAVPVTDREGNETGDYVYQGAVANKALELLGKHAGMFGTRLELAVPTTQPTIEGRRPVGLADVFRLASELGIRVAVGVDASNPRPALPAAADVLPDPSEDQ